MHKLPANRKGREQDEQVCFSASLAWNYHRIFTSSTIATGMSPLLELGKKDPPTPNRREIDPAQSKERNLEAPPQAELGRSFPFSLFPFFPGFRARKTAFWQLPIVPRPHAGTPAQTCRKPGSPHQGLSPSAFPGRFPNSGRWHADCKICFRRLPRKMGSGPLPRFESPARDSSS